MSLKQDVISIYKSHKQMEQNQKPISKQCICWQLIFHKGVNSTHYRKNNLFTKWCWENWTYTGQKETHIKLSQCIKMNKMHQRPKCKTETKEKNTKRKCFRTLWWAKKHCIRSHKCNKQKQKSDITNYIKVKNCSRRGTINALKRQLSE